MIRPLLALGVLFLFLGWVLSLVGAEYRQYVTDGGDLVTCARKTETGCGVTLEVCTTGKTYFCQKALRDLGAINGD